MSVGPISNASRALDAYRAQARQATEKRAEGGGFADRMEAAIRSVSDRQVHADAELEKLARGDGTDIHRTMIALQEADVSLRTMVAVRDKVVEAYQQIMNMTI